jgi:hypothetical protein
MSVRDDLKAAFEEYRTLFEEMQNANDRVAAVSSAAWVDDTLAAALSTRFVKMGKTWTDRVFDGAGAPLGTFSAKIVIGYALGLFGPLTRTDLDCKSLDLI